MWQNFLLFLAENRWPITFICLLGLILMAAFAVYKSFDPSKSVQNLQKKSSFQVLILPGAEVTIGFLLCL